MNLLELMTVGALGLISPPPSIYKGKTGENCRGGTAWPPIAPFGGHGQIGRLRSLPGTPRTCPFRQWFFGNAAATLVLILGCSFFLTAQTPPATTVPVSLEWEAETGVGKYRLQIATDEAFTDICFDGLVTGNHYTVNDLEPGRYYWRVAASGSETGQFAKPLSFEVVLETAKPAETVKREVPRIVSSPGWLATIGEMRKPLAVKLRFSSLTDFIGVNTEGTVYALDGKSGVALWTARYQLDPAVGKTKESERQFIPIVFAMPDGISRVLAAFHGGVHLLNGATGRELWRTDLPGRVASGVLVVSNPGPHFFLIGDNEEKLFVIEAATGHLEAQAKLKSQAVGLPLALSDKDGPAVLIPLEDGAVAFHGLDANQIRLVKLDSDITTSPLLVNTAHGLRLLIGTKKALIVLDTTEFKIVSRISPDLDQYPIGELSVADLDGDKTPDLLMTMNGGRVVAVTIDDDAMKWSVDVGNEAVAAGFADLNGDDVLDVILPGKEFFAVVLSGTDGSVLWRSSDEAGNSRPLKARARPRSLAIGRAAEGRLMIVGNDPYSAGLRGLQVQSSLVKSNP